MFEQRHPAPLVLLGLIAGIVAFIGCFVSFFAGGATGSIVTGPNNSFWFAFTPVLLGLATLALLVPRMTVAAILPLGAVGLALAAKASIDSIDFGSFTRNLARALGSPISAGSAAHLNSAVHSGFGPGPGFFMIVIGGTVLALIWARIVHDMVVARFGSITEIIAVRTTVPASPGASSEVPTSPPAPTATPDMTAAPAPDPGPSPSS